MNFIIISPIGTMNARAGLWGDYGDSVITGVKGLLILFIMNLIYRNTGEDEGADEDLITSTIESGLGLGQDENVEDEKEDFPQEVEIIPVEEEENKIQSEEQMLNLVNEVRSNNGLSELKMTAELSQLAQLKAEDMAQNDYFSHQSPTYGSPFDLLDDRGIKYSLASENIVRAETVYEGFQELMGSEEHRENILNLRYNKMGIGIVEGGPFGLIIVQKLIAG